VRFLNKAFKINFVIVRKYLGLDSTLKLSLAVLTVVALLVGMKYAMFFVPDDGTFFMYWLLATFSFSLPLSDVLYTEMSVAHKKMLTYFEGIPAKDIASYYTYRKFLMFTSWTIFLFFPMALDKAAHALFMMSCVAFGVMVTTSVHCIFRDERKTKYTRTLMQGLLVFPSWFVLQTSGDFSDISNVLANIPLFYFICCSIICYTITYANVGRSYVVSTNNSERTVRYTSLKNIYILYIMRKGMIPVLLTLLIGTFIGFDQALFNPLGFVSTVVTSYITIYEALLYNDQSKVQLFYKPNELYKIRLDKLMAVLKFSVVYLCLAIGLGLYTNKLLSYGIAYCISIVIFVITALVVKLNIEKRIDNKVTTWKDSIRIIACTMLFLWLSTYIL